MIPLGDTQETRNVSHFKKVHSKLIATNFSDDENDDLSDTGTNLA